MPRILDAAPRCSVWLFKLVDRTTVSGGVPVSSRYAGKDPYIDLTALLGDGSSIRTSKSVREPAGSFSITVVDQPEMDWATGTLETVYGLVEPMDIIEIRMWGGTGGIPPSVDYPIIMRGFVSEVTRGQSVGEDGRPHRTVTISGQDYGKIWQIYQVIYLPAYAEGQALLTSYQLFELFGGEAVNSMKAGDFVKKAINDIINPHIRDMFTPPFPAVIPREISATDGIIVSRGQVNMSSRDFTGSVYDILKKHGDVGVWNELYVEDREDGVHCVYRPIPALSLGTGALIQPDARMPPVSPVFDSEVVSITNSRNDANVANFYWVDNSRFDLISDLSRKMHGLAEGSVSIKDYPNSAKRYYGIRPMYASTQLAGDEVTNQTSGLDQEKQTERDTRQLAWIDVRRKEMIEMNKDNVVFERGVAVVKGCPMRPGGAEPMRAGDYASFVFGQISALAYIPQIDHEFRPYQGYTTTLHFERGVGFAQRIQVGGASPWLLEQASRAGGI